ncbi:MAG: chloride channel protein, partial [Oscillospiraceae bacterium]
MKCQRGQFNKIAEQPIILLKWIAFAGIIGLVVGGVSSGFYFAFNYVTMLFNTYSWILFLLPVGGISIVLLYKLCGVDKDRGTNFVLLAVRENAVLPLRTAP